MYDYFWYMIIIGIRLFLRNVKFGNIFKSLLWIKLLKTKLQTYPIIPVLIKVLFII